MRASVFHVLSLNGKKENLNNRDVTQLTYSLDWLKQLVMYFLLLDLCFLSINRNLAMNELDDFPDLSTNTALQEL